MTKTVAPTLGELKTRECSTAELQAAIVQLIELHNGLNNAINELMNSGRIRSAKQTSMDTPYGL